jgi:hypothetical protein
MFDPTAYNSSRLVFDIYAWEGYGTPNETWSLSAIEYPSVSFGIRKTAAQTIEIGGADAGLVSRAESGTIDGSAAGPELHIITVNTGAFDLMFKGGSRSFSLSLREGKEIVKTITVKLHIQINQTGVAVFRVSRGGAKEIGAAMSPADAEAWALGGTLARIPAETIRAWDLTAKDFSRDRDMGTRVLDALVWVDQNAEDNGEYLIRVENDEELPRIILQAKRFRNVVPGRRYIVRLRGAGAEKKLSYMGGSAVYVNPESATSFSSSPFFYINPDSTGVPVEFRYPRGAIDLILEENITVTPQGGGVQSVIYVSADRTTSSRFIMLSGSKISGYSSSGSSSYAVVRILSNSSSDIWGTFMMFGGEISGNSVHATESGLIVFPGSSFHMGPYFIKKGGIISGNFDHLGNPSNKLHASNGLFDIEN